MYFESFFSFISLTFLTFSRFFHVCCTAIVFVCVRMFLVWHSDYFSMRSLCFWCLFFLVHSECCSNAAHAFGLAARSFRFVAWLQSWISWRQRRRLLWTHQPCTHRPWCGTHKKQIVLHRLYWQCLTHSDTNYLTLLDTGFDIFNMIYMLRYAVRVKHLGTYHFYSVYGFRMFWMF